MTGKENIKARLNSNWNKSKAFFLKNKKNALVFLLCLIISFGCWLGIMQNKTYEVWVNYPVQYNNAPPDVELYADLNTSISIRVRDKAKNVFQYQNRNFRPAVVDFRNNDVVTLNGNSYSISFSNLFESSIKQNFSQTSVIVDYFPKDLSFEVVEIDSKKLPVKPNLNISCRKQFHLSDSITIKPDSVTLYARKSVLDTINVIQTHELRVSNLNDTLSTSLGLALPQRTKSVPSRIEVFVPVESFTEGMQTVPVTVKNVPENLTVRTIPEQVTVNYLVGISKYSEISASDFVISIDYDNIIKSRGEDEFLEIESYPAEVTNCKITPLSVKWIIQVIEN